MPAAIASPRAEPPSGAEPDPVSDMSWKDLTLAANKAYQNGDRERAVSLYQAALCQAETLLTAAQRGRGPAEAAAILVISQHNLAELASVADQPDVARRHYQAAFDHLLWLASQSAVPVALRDSCVANLKIATISLVTHLHSSGAPISEINKAIHKARFAATDQSRHRARRGVKASNPS